MPTEKQSEPLAGERTCPTCERAPENAELLGCPEPIWDGPYKLRCSLGGDGNVCARHGRFEKERCPDDFHLAPPGRAKGQNTSSGPRERRSRPQSTPGGPDEGSRIVGAPDFPGSSSIEAARDTLADFADLPEPVSSEQGLEGEGNH